MTQRGAFILLEGVDKSGKTTQSKLLYDAFIAAGHKAELKRFPDRTTPIGKIINSYLTSSDEFLEDHAIHLLFSANRWECQSAMKDMLLSGKSIIVDRYCYSGVAFTAAKGLDIEYCKAPDTGLIAPDCVFFLDIYPTEAAKRGKYGTEIYETEAIQKKVRTQFLDHLFTNNWDCIDAINTVNVISDELCEKSFNVLKKVTNTPLSYISW